MARVGVPSSAESEMVGSLEKLLAKVDELVPGDMVIAWEPLASGLESKHDFKRLAVELRALEFFAAGSGLGPSI